MNLFRIPAGVAFLDTVAQRWLQQYATAPEGASAGLILLPTRRAARALAEAFLNANQGRPLLLPRITAIGALDEAPLALRGALDIAPAIGSAERLALLSQLILAMHGRDGAPRTVDRAWPLAAELAGLMDEAERAGIDLRATLPHAADAAHAQHWERTLDFLAIVTEHWPRVLAERGLRNPAARQVALLDAQARAWTDTPPATPVWAAGMTSAMPAVARLLRVIAHAPHGLVVLPGYEADLTEPPPQHPQAGLHALVAAIGAGPGDVREFARQAAARTDVAKTAAARADMGNSRASASAHSRPALLARAMLPADRLALWQQPIATAARAVAARGSAAQGSAVQSTLPGIMAPPGLDGLFRLAATDEQAEATAIALILRDALERPGARAALVTPDRVLAARVVAELIRFGVVADDSAGEKLADTPPGSFLRLLARAFAERLAPVPLLSVLKHPLAAAGLAPPACRAAIRALEMLVLRGPRPLPDRAGLRRAIDHAVRRQPARAALRDMFDRVDTALAVATRMDAAVAQSPAARLDALIEAAEALAATDDTAGPARLWSGEEGEALAQHLAEIRDALTLLDAHDMPPDALPGLLDAVLDGAVVRSRRALRGRVATEEHPRLFIWGLLEARLQAVDVVVLAGLAEGTWPPAAEPGPWLSRPMRTAIGLPSPEERIGQAAHDFVMAACCAPVAVLSCPARRDGAPAVPARFLVRLETMLAAQGRALPQHPAATWAALLDQPTASESITPPAPRPPLRLRPRELNLTEVETWRRDPYTLYARHILRLAALDPLDAEAEAADFGNVVHRAMQRLIELHGAELQGAGWPPVPAAARACFEMTLAAAQISTPLATWWRPRLLRIADWIAATEAARPLPHALATEVAGRWRLDGPGGAFHIKGRADRIERRADGALTLIDYKTGTVPSGKEIEAGFAPQLPLLAAMAAAGAMLGWDAKAAELGYWKLSGGLTAGELKPLCGGDPGKIAASVSQARDGLRGLIALYDDPATPYRSRPWPKFASRSTDYALLARVAEWAAAEDDYEP